MQTEIEAKFLDVDHDVVRAKLKKLGAVCERPHTLMRRKNFDFPVRKQMAGWVRVRDEGGKITLSYKQMNDRGVHGTKEINVTVDDFEKTCQLLLALGLAQTSYQETKRESWKLGQTEIELDEWPWLEPLAEIEAASEQKLWEVAKLLGLDKHQILHGPADGHYALKYNVTEDEINALPEITFSPVPAWLEAKKK